MKNIQQNEINLMIKTIKNHPLCQEFIDETKYYLVIFPYGHLINGKRQSKFFGELTALKKILQVMEKNLT